MYVCVCVCVCVSVCVCACMCLCVYVRAEVYTLTVRPAHDKNTSYWLGTMHVESSKQFCAYASRQEYMHLRVGLSKTPGVGKLSWFDIIEHFKNTDT